MPDCLGVKVFRYIAEQPGGVRLHRIYFLTTYMTHTAMIFSIARVYKGIVLGASMLGIVWLRVWVDTTVMTEEISFWRELTLQPQKKRLHISSLLHPRMFYYSTRQFPYKWLYTQDSTLPRHYNNKAFLTRQTEKNTNSLNYFQASHSTK